MRSRFLASLLALFVPALGICGTLAPLQAFASCCAASPEAETSSCCAEEESAPESCTPDPGAPISPGCRSCDLGVTLTSKEDAPQTKDAPDAASDATIDPVVVFSPVRAAASLRLAVLAASPPLNLLHETFRN